MKAKTIKDRTAHRAALRRIEALMDRERLTAAAETELELLGVLVERYEDEHWPVPPVSPVAGRGGFPVSSHRGGGAVVMPTLPAPRRVCASSIAFGANRFRGLRRRPLALHLRRANGAAPGIPTGCQNVAGG